jgi:hypothetical protein
VHADSKLVINAPKWNIEARRSSGFAAAATYSKKRTPKRKKKDEAAE